MATLLWNCCVRNLIGQAPVLSLAKDKDKPQPKPKPVASGNPQRAPALVEWPENGGA